MDSHTTAAGQELRQSPGGVLARPLRVPVVVRATATPEKKEPTARKNLSVCVVDDDAAMVDLVVTLLEGMGFPALGTANPAEALEWVRAGACRVVISDMKMPQMDGLEFLHRALESDPELHVLLMTGYYSVDSAIEAVKRGAYDYLCKPLDRARLERTLDELAEQETRDQRIFALEEQFLQDAEFHGMVGRSPAMLEVFGLIQKIAKHYTNTLITGPTGSGKELVARALHQLSPVGPQRFAVCNCSALVDTLLESQLFGHVRGAFTGATDTRPGLFEYAHGGTVFLDEIGEIPMPTQVKLLRVVQNREIQRVGSPEVKHVHVRLIAATNRDLRAEVQAGRFREDLFYRLSTIQVRVPGLAERPDDVPLLTHFLLRKYSEAYGKKILGITRRARTVLQHYPWPGNVRELENVISTACMTVANTTIDVGDLPEQIRKPQPAGGLTENWRPLPLEEVRRQHIRRVLEMCGGNRVRAAELLGIGRTSLYRFLKRNATSKPAA